MEYIQRYNKYIKEGLYTKVKNLSINGLFKNSVDFSKSFLRGIVREGKETRQAIYILRKMIKGKEISDSEKKFFRKQIGDLIKIFPLVAIQGLPGGTVAITPLLMALGKKYNFNPFPTKNDPIED